MKQADYSRTWKSMDDVLDMAIVWENESRDFYDEIARRVEIPAVRRILLGLAAQEAAHAAKLAKLKRLAVREPVEAKAPAIPMGRYLLVVKAYPDLTRREAIDYALRKERAAFRLYTDLARNTKDQTFRGVLLGLAQQESKHKLVLEKEYDRLVILQKGGSSLQGHEPSGKPKCGARKSPKKRVRRGLSWLGRV